MAVPKHKSSKMQSHSRSANWKVKTSSVVECPQCHAMKLNHRVCPHCGCYDSVERVQVNKKKD